MCIRDRGIVALGEDHGADRERAGVVHRRLNGGLIVDKAGAGGIAQGARLIDADLAGGGQQAPVAPLERAFAQVGICLLYTSRCV